MSPHTEKTTKCFQHCNHTKYLVLLIFEQPLYLYQTVQYHDYQHHNMAYDNEKKHIEHFYFLHHHI